MNNKTLTLLSRGQLLGDLSEDQLEVFQKFGTQTEISDLGILTGGYFRSFSNTKMGPIRRVGAIWTTSAMKERVGGIDIGSGVCTSDIYGWCDSANGQRRDFVIRPVLQSSEIYYRLFPSKVKGNNDTYEVEYLEYPQFVASQKDQENLNKSLTLSQMPFLNKTGRDYTFDSIDPSDRITGFSGVTYPEYEYQGKKYILVKANFMSKNALIRLSNGIEYKNGDFVWVEVSPVNWLVDDKTKLLISKIGLVSGIRYCANNSYNYDGDFNKTEMKIYLNNHMSKDLFQSKALPKVQNITSEEEISIETNLLSEGKRNMSQRLQNPYGFDFQEVSEEEIIKGAIESNVAVFLHGRSSEGKSARVKQLDPDCEIIYLRNATPESLNGKSVFNSQTGEMIDVPPTWFKKITKKCEEEKDKIHIVFFDEITNALPSIQGMAFNIVLDGEVNGIWKLPKNARIVAAGNDLNDSLAANTMAEPLFNRFAHVYINTTTSSWLKWAATPKKSYGRLDYEKEKEYLTIHPAIYAYVAYKYYGGQDVLRTPYTGEKPNADPRKWEMASKVLYKTGKPEMLRALIGEELAIDFANFAKQSVITVEDVLNENYSDEDLKMDTAQKFVTAASLSIVDEKNFETIRNFVMKLGSEFVAIFNNLWSHGDEKRLEQIAEMKMIESLGGMKK